MHKDKWPIPLPNTNYMRLSSMTPLLYFNSTYPSLLIDPKPITFRPPSLAHHMPIELLQVFDPLFVQTFTDTLISPFCYDD